MNSPTSPRTSRPALTRFLVGALVVAAGLAGAPRAHAGWDDFEFGQKLISKGYIEQARKVFEKILADDKRSQTDKDRARFGMALLGKAEAQAAGPNPKVPAKDVRAKFDAALASIREFLQANPNDAKAADARGEIGGLALWFVDWASALARADKGDREARGAVPAELLEAADKAADNAIEAYTGLMESARKREEDRPNDPKRREERQLAEYRYVTAIFYKTFPLEPCSAKHITALQDAKAKLDDYATANDGVLTGVYALDNLGRVLQELAQCEADPEKKFQLFSNAHQQYMSCAGTPDEGDAYRQLIASGYLHDARLANHIPNLEEARYTALAREIDRSLTGFGRAAPKAFRVHDGADAQVEHALLLLTLQEKARALDAAKTASDVATQEGYSDVKRRADSILQQIVGAGGGASSSGGGGGGADPTMSNVDASVIFKVGESLKRDGKYGEAIGAFQQAIPAAGPSRADFVQWVLPAWVNIGDCYRQMTPPLWLESAMAYDAVVDYVRAGTIKPTNENDPASKTAYSASTFELAALKKLVETAADPGIQERVRRFDKESYDLFKNYQGGGGITDRGFGNGIEAFNRGLKAKGDADGKGEAWKAPFKESVQYFADVAKNPKSDYQDKAYKYLVRVPYEMDDDAGAVAAADQALTFWDSAEAKKRIEEPGVAERRRAESAEVRYWKAAALHALKRDDQSLPLLDALIADKSAPFRDRAMGLRVEVLLDQGKGPEGEAELRKLTKEYPEYYNLAKLLLRVASVYDEANKALQTKVDALTKRLVGTQDDRASGLDAQRKAADREQTALVPTISDLSGVIKRREAIVQFGKNVLEKQKAEEELKENRLKLADARDRLAKVRTKLAELTAEIDKVSAEKQALQRQQVAPLKKAADLYLQLDESLKDLDAKAGPGERRRRRPDPVNRLAYQYYYLAKLQPEEASHWTTSRSLYEDYLGMPELKGAAESEEAKRKVQRFLGEIYDHLADVATTPEDKQQQAANAVKYLQGSIARVPANLPVVLAHLSGETMVVSFRDPTTDKRWSIPMRRSTDVATFRQAVKELGPANLPSYANDRTQKEYLNAVKQFKEQIEQMPDEQVKATMGHLSTSFDPTFFTEHAVSLPDFLLDLARSYLRSGVAENAYKALNLAAVVLNGNSKAETDSPEWWDAQTLQLRALVEIAEREASASSDSGVAKQRAARADTLLRTMKSLYPRIGGLDSEVHARTLKAWKDLQIKLQGVQGRLGLPANTIDLEAEPPPPKEAEEPPPAPPTPATPPAPAPTDGMDDQGMEGSK